MQDKTTIVTLVEHVKKQTQSIPCRMKRAGARNQPNTKVGNYVYFWREKNKCLGPSKVTCVDDNIITVLQNGIEKKTSLNRVLPTQIPDAALLEKMYNDDPWKEPVIDKNIEKDDVDVTAALRYHVRTYLGSLLRTMKIPEAMTNLIPAKITIRYRMLNNLFPTPLVIGRSRTYHLSTRMATPYIQLTTMDLCTLHLALSS